MKLNIAFDTHVNDTQNALEKAINGIEKLYEEVCQEVEYQEIKEIIEIVIDWYETKNINIYTFFNKAFPTDIGPTIFYSGLTSFLVNTLLDDSYYEIKWEKYNSQTGGYDLGQPWKDLPYAVWCPEPRADTYGTQIPTEMLKAIKYLIEQDKQMEKLEQELQDTLNKWKEQQVIK